MKYAYFFDFDGVLVNTMEAHFICYKKALEEAGANMQHIVRTRMFLTDISRWQEVGRAHGEVFHEIRPASTAVEVSGLIHPDLVIEIEATAIIP